MIKWYEAELAAKAWFISCVYMLGAIAVMISSFLLMVTLIIVIIKLLSGEISI